MQESSIDFLVWVHTLPDELRKPLAPDRDHLQETSDIYQFVIDSQLFWRVWMIDEWSKLWINVERMGVDNKPESHTLRLDDGTFEKFECELYKVEDERRGSQVSTSQGQSRPSQQE